MRLDCIHILHTPGHDQVCVSSSLQGLQFDPLQSGNKITPICQFGWSGVISFDAHSMLNLECTTNTMVTVNVSYMLWGEPHTHCTSCTCIACHSVSLCIIWGCQHSLTLSTLCTWQIYNHRRSLISMSSFLEWEGSLNVLGENASMNYW